MGFRLGIGNIDLRNIRSAFDWAAWWASHSPTNLIVTAIVGGNRLDWVDNCDREDGFEIWISIDGADYVLLDTVGANITTYDDLVSEGILLYKVRAFIGTNESEFSDEASITTSYFTTTWDTENAGSATKTIVVPTTGAGYDCYIKWDTEPVWEHFTGTPGNITHVFATTGIKTVKIAGTFPRIYFNDAGDKLKLLTIANWGNIAWDSFAIAFRGCSNMNCTATDSANTSAVTTFVRAFHSCTSMTALNVSGWDTSLVNTFYQTFYNCPLLTALDVSGWDTSAVTTFVRAFYNCVALKGSFATLELTLCTDVTDMLAATNINAPGTTTNYDATLISFAAQIVTAAMSFHGGLAKYGEGLVDSGTADGTTANKLVDSTQNFLTTVTIGDVVYNTTDGTYARVTNVDNNTTLSLDNDIMVNGEVYRIQHSDAAKARASLILDDTWTITDGGYL